MLTLNIDYEVLPDRLVTIKLPETVRLGRHELVVVLEENDVNKKVADTNAKTLMQFAGSVTAFNGVDGVEYQKKVRSEWH
ncbi:MAG: hypothetical protein Q7J80_01670 [Anaerolineales bacterium]|nr:hypothetical protein [Anaerolineales bacterium]